MANGGSDPPGTNVPGLTFTPTGFVAPQASAVLAGVQADISAAFGTGLNFNLNTPQGQLSSSLAAIIANTNQTFAYYSQQVDPAFASGRFQDGIGRIYFMTRNPALPTTLQVLCVGLTGTTIPVGALVIDPASNIYSCLGSGIIAAGGTVALSFAALVAGSIGVPNSVSIYQAIPGWDSASVISGIQGTNVESRASFEARRAASVASNSQGPIGAIIGAVAAVPGVLDYYGYNNNTNGSVTIGGVLIAPYAIYVCVAGGAPAAIAQAILSKKGPGAPMTGNTTVTAYDSNPLYSSPIAYSITYQIPSPLQLLYKVTLVNSPQLPANAGMLVQNALLAAFAGQTPGIPKARIASTLYATGYVPAIAALGSWAQVSAIGIGSANTPDATVHGYIVGNTLTVTSVTSGSVAVGQTLADGTGSGILNGTSVTIFGSGAGGTGTYTVNQPQTAFSAGSPGTILLSSPDQTLVVVQANQIPQLTASNIVVVHT
jgi:hypothetical protein